MESFDEVLFTKADFDANFLRPIVPGFGPFPRFDWNEEALGERGIMLEGLSLRVGMTIDCASGLLDAGSETTFWERESGEGRSGDDLTGFAFGGVSDEFEVEGGVELADEPVSDGDFLISPPPLNDALNLFRPR
jgi:hypothetical protein